MIGKCLALFCWLALVFEASGQTSQQYLADGAGQTAYQYLSHIQQVAGMRPTQLSPNLTKEEVLEFFAKEARRVADIDYSYAADKLAERKQFAQRLQKDFLDTYNAALPFLPTRYSDLATFHLVSKKAVSIQGAAKALGFEVDRPIVFGDVPSTCVNAMAIRVPDTMERLIVVNSSIFANSLMIAELAALSVGLGKSEAGLQLDARLETAYRRLADPDVTEQFAHALTAYFARGVVREKRFVERDRWLTTQYIKEGIDLFVIGHEYAHVLLGHTDQNTKSIGLLMTPADGEKSTGVPRISIEVAARSRAQELAADELGLKLALKAAELNAELSAYKVLIAWAPEVLFSWQDVMDRAMEALGGGIAADYRASDHPSPSERLGKLQRYRAESGMVTPSVDGIWSAWMNAISILEASELAPHIRSVFPKLNLTECH